MIVFTGIMCLLWGSLYDAFKSVKILRVLKKLFMICFILITAYSVFTCVMGHKDNATGKEEYAIVPGAGLRNEEPSPLLKSRLDTTLDYLVQNKKATVIVTGGKGDDEDIAESIAMYTYLTDSGVNDKDILTEDQATSTYENYLLTKDAVSDGDTVIITSEFHVLRSLQMAKLNGIDATHIGATTPFVYLPPACAREFLAQVMAVRY